MGTAAKKSQDAAHRLAALANGCQVSRGIPRWCLQPRAGLCCCVGLLLSGGRRQQGVRHRREALKARPLVLDGVVTDLGDGLPLQIADGGQLALEVCELLCDLGVLLPVLFDLLLQPCLPPILRSRDILKFLYSLWPVVL